MKGISIDTPSESYGSLNIFAKPTRRTSLYRRERSPACSEEVLLRGRALALASEVMLYCPTITALFVSTATWRQMRDRPSR
ncbi:hypothetical protein BDW68DRAFT_39673 [Aspergillus falconensis]